MMSSFPTIFDWLDRFSALRGEPAAYLILLTTMLILLVRDWRVTVAGLALQYLVAGLLFADVLDPRLTLTKTLTGLFICLILYITARQVDWGKLPEDISPAEAVQLRDDRRLRFGRFLLPTSGLFRLFLALMMGLVVLTITAQTAFRLPAIQSGYLNQAVLALMAFGLLNAALTTEPLRAGIGLLTFFLGFELYYSGLEQSLPILVALSAINLIAALVISYLTQVRHAIPALFKRSEAGRSDPATAGDGPPAS